MRNTPFKVVKAKKDPESRKRLTEYYSRKGITIQFHDKVEFDHTDEPNLKYAETLCPLGLLMYAEIFGVSLHKDRMFTSNLKIFGEEILKNNLKPDETKINSGTEEDLDDDDQSQDESKEITEESSDDKHKDSEQKTLEPEKSDEKTSEESIPEDRKCPYCGATARTDKSYLKNHGKNCSRYIEE